MRRPAVPFIAAVLLAACASAGVTRPRPAAPETVGRGCPPERARDGEVRLAFLGDSGYGTGVSEWGTHGQEALAERLNRLDLRPDLVFFLGDNIYWLGNAELYKSRFDDVYDPIIRECRAEANARLDPAMAAWIAVPTLLLIGEHSTDPCKAQIEAVASALPNARIVVIEGQEHVADALAPKQFAEKLMSFLHEGH